MKKYIALIALAAALAAATSCKDRFKTNSGAFGPDAPLVSSVSLNVHEETLTAPGGTLQLTATVYPEGALNKEVRWSSSKESIATVSQDGLVTACHPGRADITVTTLDGGKTDVCHVTVEGPDPKAVDLGLSVKWADINVGAISESDPGSYFAWGEVGTKDLYKDSNYKYRGGDSKPNPPSVLPASEDAASVNLGGSWRMPTKEEAQELISNCTWEKTSVDGKEGWRVSRNGKSIFLPFTGYWDSKLNSLDKNAAYATSNLKDVSKSAYEGYLCFFYALFIDEDEHMVGGYTGYYGYPVRAVRP